MSYIEMKCPWVYMSSPSRSPLPPPSPPAPSRSSQITRSERLSHASNLGWWSVSPLIVYLFRWDNFFLTLTANKLEFFSRYSLVVQFYRANELFTFIFLVVHIFTEIMSYLHFSDSHFYLTAQNPELFHAQSSNIR